MSACPSRTPRRVARFRAGRFGDDRSGVSAVEFALIAPMFGVILAGAIDIGGALYTQFGLNAAVSAGANYAMVNGSSATSTAGGSLATTIGDIAASSQGTNWATATVVVNNGPTNSGGGTASNADSCYCPTGTSAASIAWGAALTCGSACSGGGVAGKFVTVQASRTYAPFFPVYNFISSTHQIIASMVVQVQ
jgi:Flp pilus assembly protein TadG